MQPEAVQIAPDETDNLLSLMQLSEETLLRLAQAGDEEAFGVILYKVEAPLRRFIRRLIGNSDGGRHRAGRVHRVLSQSGECGC
jgi:hypothetical protein